MRNDIPVGMVKSSAPTHRWLFNGDSATEIGPWGHWAAGAEGKEPSEAHLEDELHVGGVCCAALRGTVMRAALRSKAKQSKAVTGALQDAEEFEKAWLLLADLYVQQGKFDLAQATPPPQPLQTRIARRLSQRERGRRCSSDVRRQHWTSAGTLQAVPKTQHVLLEGLGVSPCCMHHLACAILRATLHSCEQVHGCRDGERAGVP